MGFPSGFYKWVPSPKWVLSGIPSGTPSKEVNIDFYFLNHIADYKYSKKYAAMI